MDSLFEFMPEDVITYVLGPYHHYPLQCPGSGWENILTDQLMNDVQHEWIRDSGNELTSEQQKKVIDFLNAHIEDAVCVVMFNEMYNEIHYQQKYTMGPLEFCQRLFDHYLFSWCGKVFRRDFLDAREWMTKIPNHLHVLFALSNDLSSVDFRLHLFERMFEFNKTQILLRISSL